MEYQFNKTGPERKALVAAIGEITGEKSKYMGAPGFAFQIGGFTVSKDGAVDTGAAGTEAVTALLTALDARGFVPANAPDESPVSAPYEHGAEPTAICISLPADGLADAGAFDNLRKLVAGKAALIRKALGDDLAEGAEELPVTLEEGNACFPWFRFGMDANRIKAWSYFVSALCETAKKQKRVILKEKPLAEGDSEKFAMRVFLLKLGFIGEESKEARRIILSGLSGDGSHKSAKRKVEPLFPAPGEAEPVGASGDFSEPDEDRRLVRGGLCSVPPTDCNYASYLRDATDSQLCEAIAYMESSPKGNNGRIAACRRELQRRNAL